jgi:dethiobiotin synthetase
MEKRLIPEDFPGRFFVTGTDTAVGKTVVCAVLSAGLKAAYWKPIQSGLEEADTDWVRKVTGLPDGHFFKETYRLYQPLSPHAAAEADGVRIVLSDIHLPEAGGFSYLIVEGAGGVMVPLNHRHFMIDLMARLRLPVLLVARSSLGTINHTLLSLEQLRRNGLEVFGVVMNGTKNETNRRAIEYYGRVKVSEVDVIREMTPRGLSEAFIRYFVDEP